MAQEISGSNNDWIVFLRYCLSEDNEEIPSCVSHIDWMQMLAFSLKHGITGIYAYTILEDNKPLEAAGWLGNRPTPREVLKWSKFLINIRERNKAMNKQTAATCEWFTKAGYTTCILKGQGNTLSYKNPYIRSTGDIDIWADAPRWKLFTFTRSLFPQAHFKCQHIDFPLWKDAQIELHFYPMYLENPISNRRLKDFFKQEKYKQFTNKVCLPGTESKIAIPTPFFNAIYQLTHINVHILIEGIGIRQFIDYFYVLKQLSNEDRQEIAIIVKKLKLQHLAASVMYIEHNVLGLEKKYLFTKPDVKRGVHLLKQIIADGNFGKFNTDNPGDKAFLRKQIWKIKRNRQFIFDYPSEELCEPIFRIAHLLWRLHYELKWKTYHIIYKKKHT